MNNDNQKLDELGIYQHGTPELSALEKKLCRYFDKEYSTWDGNQSLPHKYGTDPSKGPLSYSQKKKALLPYEHDFQVYKNILDDDFMAYSMGYYGNDANCVLTSTISLEQAQNNKYELISRRLGIQDGQTILDLGCGFGGYIKYLQTHYNNLEITAINPSITQSSHISEIADADNVKIITAPLETALDDLRDASFDRIVSIGVVEHFSNIALLQEIMHALLKSNGACLHHLIVSIDTIPQFLSADDTLIGKYFPHGHVWPYSTIINNSENFSEVRAWYINGLNYWKTLDEWHRNYWEHVKIDESTNYSEIEHWNNYFSLCKAMFYPHAGSKYGNAHYLCIK